jgi:hypothetical protein
LIGLVVGCASLLPSPSALGRRLQTAAVLSVFGGNSLAGILNLAKNAGGRTSAFAFNWMLNACVVDGGARHSADHQVCSPPAAASWCFFPLTYAFGFHSSLLFLFLLDIDFLYVAKLARGYGGVPGLEMPIALLTLGLGAIALYIALAMLVNPAVGRKLFPVPGPLFHVRPPRPV